ncbi:hypothetical protein QE439_000830 [Pedobacter agri]|nr:hypothetical protein [Pedobacter agri]
MVLLFMMLGISELLYLSVYALLAYAAYRLIKYMLGR